MNGLGLNENFTSIKSDKLSKQNSQTYVRALRASTCDKVSFSGRNQLINDPHLNKLLLKIGKNTRDIVKKAKPNFINGGFERDFYDLKDAKGESIGYILGIKKELWKGECRAYNHGINTDFLQPIKEFTYTFGSKFKKVPDEYPGFNVGQCVAKCKNVRIHKKVEGVTGGVIYNTKGQSLGRVHYLQNCIFKPEHFKQYSDHIERLNKLSANQECFDDFAKEIMRLSKKHMFDPNSNNTLIDAKKLKINIIDPTTKFGAEKNQCHGNHLAGMVGCLFDAKYVLKQSLQSKGGKISEQAADVNKKFVNIRQKVLKKCLLAAKKAEMSFNKNPYKEGSSYKESYDLEYLFKISGLDNKDLKKVRAASKGDFKSFENTVEKIFPFHKVL